MVRDNKGRMTWGMVVLGALFCPAVAIGWFWFNGVILNDYSIMLISLGGGVTGLFAVPLLEKYIKVPRNYFRNREKENQ